MQNRRLGSLSDLDLRARLAGLGLADVPLHTYRSWEDSLGAGEYFTMNLGSTTLNVSNGDVDRPFERP